MKIYWTLGSIPELKDIPKLEARRIWQESRIQLYCSWKTWIGFLALIVLACIGRYIGGMFDLGNLGASRIGNLIGAMVGGGTGGASLVCY